jgi:DNA polymerase III alpha subunit
MEVDKFGGMSFTEEEICQYLYKNPNIDISRFKLNPDYKHSYNHAVKALQLDWPLLSLYQNKADSIEVFDERNQSEWLMPADYQALDIAQWLLDQCKTDEELQRVGEELLLYQERNLFNLLKYMKYLVDTMRENNIIWGVGRGSSVSSYVLYLIGTHKINSIYYDLDISEFLK